MVGQQEAVRRTYASDADSESDATADPAGGRWKARPVAAWACRAAIAFAPVAVALMVTLTVQILVFTLLLTGHGVGWHIGAYVALAAATMGIAVLVERVARRALPLVPLLRLTMLFPDQAPSRFAMARTAGNPAALARLAERGDAQGAAALQVLSLLTRLSEHERRTRGHSERVRVYADLLGEQMGLAAEDRARLRLAALVHDVGKLTVPAEVLTKPGRPTTEEWATLQGHPEAGVELAGALVTWLGPWTGSINEHHERFDGTGYPRRLAGDRISLAGRIVAVADAFETMTANRSYKKPMSIVAARQELTDCAGTHFDPAVVRAFMDISLPRLRRRTLAAGIFVHIPVLGPLQSAGAQLLGSAGPLGTSALATISAGGAPASAAVMTVLATTVAVGVLPAAAATGATAHPSRTTSTPHTIQSSPPLATGHSLGAPARRTQDRATSPTPSLPLTHRTAVAVNSMDPASHTSTLNALPPWAPVTTTAPATSRPQAESAATAAPPPAPKKDAAPTKKGTAPTKKGTAPTKKGTAPTKKVTPAPKVKPSPPKGGPPATAISPAKGTPPVKPTPPAKKTPAPVSPLPQKTKGPHFLGKTAAFPAGRG